MVRKIKGKDKGTIFSLRYSMMVVFNWSSKCRLHQGPIHIVFLHGKVY